MEMNNRFISGFLSSSAARTAVLAVTVVATGVFVLSCGNSKKLSEIERKALSAQLVLAKESDVPELEYRATKRDTLVVQDESGKDILIMKAVRDDETGEMVATETLDAAIVTARFRNVAERSGRVDLNFQVIVPEEMQDTRWQLRFFPDMFIMEDSLRLESVIITGDQYRKAQLKGYQQYEKFLATIISDSTKFINVKMLERFLERNIPQVFAFKTDSTIVSDETFYSFYGVSDKMALEHYTDRFAIRRNDRRIARREKMYRKYVKAPIETDGVRLDTVMRSANGDFIYNYVQTIRTRPKLRKVDIILSGDIYEEDRIIYRVPRTEPLTFYVSSISSFADQSEHYLSRVIERKAEANASYKIEFAQGRSDIQLDRGDNYTQVGFVKDNLVDLLNNEVYDLDSIVIVANASPEGSYALNGTLSKRRGDAVVKYFEDFMKDYRAQIDREKGFEVDEFGNMTAASSKIPLIRFISRSVPENWDLLDRLMRNDPRIDDEMRERYFSHEDVADKDRREQLMKGDPSYRFIADSLYSYLRVVDFEFHLHRKGMIRDYELTTELDERYMQGVQMLRDMDYDEAIKILGPYQDYNAAVAYMGAERNASARLILEGLERTPQVNYLLAILYSRMSDEAKAVQCYLDACRQEPSYVHRGNLDPEISQLIRLYGLNQQEEEEFDF